VKGGDSFSYSIGSNPASSFYQRPSRKQTFICRSSKNLKFEAT
jgi:hypothetical protein